MLFWLKYTKKICPHADLSIWKREELLAPCKGVSTLESLHHTLKTASLDFCFYSQKRLDDWVGILIRLLFVSFSVNLHFIHFVVLPVWF